jgi:hypothetical protein
LGKDEMKTFKTPKGTELPITDLRGKDYLMVCYRLVWFREDHPDWTIKTECVDMNEKSCLFRAEIFNENNTLVSVGHKREEKAHFHDYEEKAETGSIGRALAHCGYGTQFAPDIHEDDRIVDAPIGPKGLNKALPPHEEDISKRYFNPLPDNEEELRDFEALLDSPPGGDQGNKLVTFGRYKDHKFRDVVTYLDYMRFVKKSGPESKGQLKDLYLYAKSLGVFENLS